ncbi:MAG TPA: TonB-dependent receptor [Thermoanaerobaculia bacterium]|nr:TonB-dependent receptor [Thermoanaerobaculia bacterium]
MPSAWRILFCALLAAWVLTMPAGAGEGGDGRREEATFQGLSLTAALQLLQARGLPVVFSNSVVHDSMRVEAEPRGTSLREIVDEILRPHGLRVAEVLAGRLVVVAATPAARTLRGRAFVRGEGRPLADVRVVVAGTLDATTAADGSFAVPGLAPGIYTLEAHRTGFASGRWPGVEIAAERDRQVIIELDRVPTVTDEIVVTPGPSGRRQEGAAGTLAVDGAEVEQLPHLGDDRLGLLGLLPGTAAAEGSARLHVRGGRDDEILVLLDGLELLAPYHLQEFDSALSIVAPTLLDRIELSTGGYPAEYGDRMSGVVDMMTLTPPRERRFELGLGLLYADAAASGGLAGDRGRWFGAARSGNYHLALEVNGRDETPRYWDVFSKLDYSIRPGQSLRLNALLAEDEFALSAGKGFGIAAAQPADERYRSFWGNRYLWLTHGAVLGSDLFIESIASAGRIDRSRAGSAAGSETRFEVRDSRQLDVAGLKHLWRYEPGERRSFEAGVELRRLRSNIDYRDQRALADPFASLGGRPPSGSARFHEILDFDQTGAFLTSTLRPSSAVTAELGIRYDRTTANDESHVSPRLNLAWQPRQGSLFRFAWGWYYQSQRPNELQVEDGETELTRAERAEHRILGFEHRRDSGATLRVEVYQRLLSRLQARFENLFDPIVLFPELTGDRVRIAPERGRSQGIDVFFRGADHGPLSWWLTYTWSSVTDELDGRRVPRAVDQPHALRVDLNYRTERGWNWNAAWLYHTGWPTTRVWGRVVTAPDGTSRIEPVLGPLNGDRLADYHRLDLRLSRAWKLPLGELHTYIDLQNVYDRENVRGFQSFVFTSDENGGVRGESEPVSWGGFLPSFGIRWKF